MLYFFHDPGMPLFLITAYAKNEMANISHAERNDFRRMVVAIKA